MKREEQITKEIERIMQLKAFSKGTKEIGILLGSWWKAGAKWADRHPREGLVDIEKACEYLEFNRECVTTEDNGIMGWIPDEFIEKFRKEMEK